MPKITAVLATLGLLLASLMLAPPAGSATPPWRASITFDKNPANPSNSKLIWRLSQRTAGTWKVVQTRSWRSGSGMLGKTGRNSCVKNKGWLPNGTYAMRQYQNYGGNLIKGRAFRIDNKRCPNGTNRVDLFIHTEQGARNRQCPNRRGDQVCRWEVPAYNDYKSAGCIKLSPTHLYELTRLYHQHFSAGVRYSKARVVLRVIS
jgi:hypothetical protein